MVMKKLKCQEIKHILSALLVDSYHTEKTVNALHHRTEYYLPTLLCSNKSVAAIGLKLL